MARTEISWTDATWNPVRGCRRVSPGCEHCYAEVMAARLVRMGGYEWIDGAWRDDPAKKHNPTARAQANKYKALVRIGKDGSARWTGVFAFDADKLSEPIRRKAPTMYFVNSMSDLFGEGLTNEQIAAVFGVMAACPQHVFQILTKRPARMVEWFKWIAGEDGGPACEEGPSGVVHGAAHDAIADAATALQVWTSPSRTWPLPNVWLGVSVERQQEADERIPLLLQCPAAVRWVSAEPLLGSVDLRRYMWPVHARWPAKYRSAAEAAAAGETVTYHRQALVSAHARFIDWVVLGGESGHDARPCDVQWIRDGVTQCRKAGVPPFVKQLGAYPTIGNALPRIRDKKGADMAEWPSDLAVREWPRGFAPPKTRRLPTVG